jgi:DnaJ-domain-containing protein 1
VLRRRKKDNENDEDTVPIDTEEHAWWAARDELDSDRAPSGRTKKKPVEEEPKRNTFEDYFSTESLFDWTGADETKGLFDETDPYVVLGLPPTATWEEISAAHRRLAKLHHPDRLMNATEEERENSNRRIRDLNIAYMELRRRKGR